MGGILDILMPPASLLAAGAAFILFFFFGNAGIILLSLISIGIFVYAYLVELRKYCRLDELLTAKQDCRDIADVETLYEIEAFLAVALWVIAALLVLNGFAVPSLQRHPTAIAQLTFGNETLLVAYYPKNVSVQLLKKGCGVHIKS